jgi:hypothetical protein
MAEGISEMKSLLLHGSKLKEQFESLMAEAARS